MVALVNAGRAPYEHPYVLWLRCGSYSGVMAIGPVIMEPKGCIQSGYRCQKASFANPSSHRGQTGMLFTNRILCSFFRTPLSVSVMLTQHGHITSPSPKTSMYPFKAAIPGTGILDVQLLDTVSASKPPHLRFCSRFI